MAATRYPCGLNYVILLFFFILLLVFFFCFCKRLYFNVLNCLLQYASLSILERIFMQTNLNQRFKKWVTHHQRSANFFQEGINIYWRSIDRSGSPKTTDSGCIYYVECGHLIRGEGEAVGSSRSRAETDRRHRRIRREIQTRSDADQSG